MWRRFFFAWVIVYCGSSIVLQVALVEFLSTILLAYYLSVRPMVDRVNNFTQVFNEIVVLLCQWLMFHFTDFVTDPIVRYELGWYLLYLVATNVAVNLLVLIYVISNKIYLAARNYFLERKAKKLAQLRVQD